MEKMNQDAAYLHAQNYLDLVAYYLDHPIALYTGCGVSRSDDPAFGVGLWNESVRRILFADPVIATSDYELAWKANDVYNFTMGPQIHILRHYTVLFIGFSFRDRWVNELLIELNKERREREDRLYHYAILKKKDHHSRIKIRIPGHAGRSKSTEDKTVFLKPAEYFEELYNCRLCMVRKKKSSRRSRQVS